MAANSLIEWCHATLNPWQGCAKVSEGCRLCFAEARDRRHLHSRESHWGPRAPRRFASESYMRLPLRWNRAAEKAGERRRVFCGSLCDVFEIHAIPLYAALQMRFRQRVFDLVEETPHFDWLLLTKRPENILPLVPRSWRSRFPKNVWIGVSMENQRRAAERLPVLLDVPARVRFVSYEPALGPLDLVAAAGEDHCVPLELDWVIAGAESGPGARSAELDWFRAMRDQCAAMGIAFFLKQFAERGKKVPLPLLDGRQWTEVPRPGRVRPPKRGALDGLCDVG